MLACLLSGSACGTGCCTIAVAREFGLDVSELEVAKYFLPETSPYWLLPGCRRKRALRGLKELTAADLVESAATGKWVFSG